MPWKKARKFVAIAPAAVVGISVIAMLAPTASAADLVCRGTIHRANGDNIVFTVPWSPNTGFEQEVEFRNARTGAGIYRSSHQSNSRAMGALIGLTRVEYSATRSGAARNALPAGSRETLPSIF
jgi:hypothetical protein